MNFSTIRGLSVLRKAWRGMVMGLGLGCGACTVHSDVTVQERAAARSFTPPAGKGLLYVYRPSTPRAMLVGRPVYINDQEINSNNNGTFMAIPLKPGKYRVQAAVRPVTEDQKANYPEINLTVQSGKTYFIRQALAGSVWGSGGGETMLLQTGGTPIPIATSSGLLPFNATLVSDSIGRKECASLEQVGAELYPQ